MPAMRENTGRAATSDDPSLALVGRYSSNSPVDMAALFQCAELQNAYNRQGTVDQTPPVGLPCYSPDGFG